MSEKILKHKKRAKDASNLQHHRQVSMKNYEELMIAETYPNGQQQMNAAFEQAFYSLGNVLPKEKAKTMSFIPNTKDGHLLMLLGLEAVADYRMGRVAGVEPPKAISICAICHTDVSPMWHPHSHGAKSVILCEECQKKFLDFKISKKRLRYTEMLMLLHKRINQPKPAAIGPRAVHDP